jgi:transposase
MPQPNDLSRSLTALDEDSTLIAIIEMRQASWLVGAIVPGIERHPLKKLAPDAEELLRLLQRWRDEATKAGHAVKTVAVAFEAGPRETALVAVSSRVGRPSAGDILL